MSENLRDAALVYHEQPKPGKLEISATKPLTTQRDLALAYSPGVAAPCEEIAKNPLAVAKYTSRNNLIAVITNGTAVLGLGNIGALASKPVMEGKAVLFKKFADIDVFDIEINENDVDKLVDTIASLEPTFGGINLEDIKAPECFYVEKKLKERLNIPVFHDDQHGTAIVTAAAVLNGLEVVGKDITEVKLVCSGAGSAAIACLNLLLDLGLSRGNVLVCDSKGVLRRDRTDLDEFKTLYAADTKLESLSDAINNADVFLGLSVGGALSQDMVVKMADKPLILALANPTPEILPEDAKKVRPDAIVATGRSDYPNQVNNVLCFPFIFRGALDVGASTINEEMKLACVKAIAKLAREEIPDVVSAAYKGQQLIFGPEYILPKPFDPRLISIIPPAVAKAAVDSGVATKTEKDLESYKRKMRNIGLRTSGVMQTMFDRAKKDSKKIIYADGEDERILHTTQTMIKEGYGQPVLIGREEIISEQIKKLGMKIKPGDDFEVIDPQNLDMLEQYANDYHAIKGVDGVQLDDAMRLVSTNHTVLASLMMLRSEADAMIAGPIGKFGKHLNHIKDIIGLDKNAHIAAAMQLLTINDNIVFIADTYVNYNPDVEDIKNITLLAAREVKQFGITPNIALVSHSNFGSADNPSSRKMREALQLIKQAAPELEIDGEMQVDIALSEELRSKVSQNSQLKGRANLLIMPNADAAHITYRALREVTKGGTVGPILLGFDKQVHIVNRTVSVRAILNMSVLGLIESQKSL